MGSVAAGERLIRRSAWALQLRITVQNAARQVIDSSTSDVTVPDYTTPQVSFGTPRVYRARTPREVQAIKANPSAVPTADRAFCRTERLFVRVDAYAPGTVPPTVTARLLNRAGTSMADVPVADVRRAGAAEIEVGAGLARGR